MSQKKVKVVDTLEMRAIKALYEKGNSPAVIASVLKLTPKYVEKAVEALASAPDIFIPITRDALERKEKIADFERILYDKKGSAEIGRKLYHGLAEMSEDYEESWKADSISKFNFGNKWVGIIAMSDFHIGHEGVAYKRLAADMQLVADTPNMYITFLGDAIDNFINEKHLGAIINAVTSPKQQLYMLQYLLSILKEPKKKILFVTKDNHVTQRLKKTTGIDWSNKMWSDYGVFYGGEEIRCEITIGSQTYVIIGRHSGRGQSNVHLTAGCKKLLREGMHDDADIIMLAHKHEGALEVFSYRGKVRTAVQTSTYKQYDPHAASLGFMRPEVFMPVLLCNPETKEMIPVKTVSTAARLLKMLNKGK